MLEKLLLQSAFNVKFGQKQRWNTYSVISISNIIRMLSHLFIFCCRKNYGMDEGMLPFILFVAVHEKHIFSRIIYACNLRIVPL